MKTNVDNKCPICHFGLNEGTIFDSNEKVVIVKDQKYSVAVHESCGLAAVQAYFRLKDFKEAWSNL